MIRLLLLALLSLPAIAIAAQPTVLVLGDSLSAGYGIDREQGWVALLAQRLAQTDDPHRVINASVSGDTTVGGMTRLPELLQQYHPDLVILELGANDGLRGLNPELIQSNLETLIQHIRAAGSRVLLLGVRLPPNYGAVYTKRFQAVFQAVAESQNVALVPAMLAGISEHLDQMQADGLHPLASAQPRVLDNIWPTLEPLLKRSGNPAAAPQS